MRWPVVARMGALAVVAGTGAFAGFVASGIAYQRWWAPVCAVPDDGVLYSLLCAVPITPAWVRAVGGVLAGAVFLALTIGGARAIRRGREGYLVVAASGALAGVVAGFLNHQRGMGRLLPVPMPEGMPGVPSAPLFPAAWMLTVSAAIGVVAGILLAVVGLWATSRSELTPIAHSH